MRHALAATLLLGASALPVQALDLGNGFSLIGEVELEYGNNATTANSYLDTDATLRWRSADGGAFGFGFDFGVESLYLLDESDDLTMFWGGLVITSDFGDFTLGAARPVADTVYAFPDFGTNSVNQLLLFPMTRSLASFFGLITDEQVLGVSFVGSSEALGYAVSIHEIDTPINTLRSSQLVLTYAAGNTSVMGSFEVMGVGLPENITAFRFGVLHEIGALTLGAEAGALESPTADTQNFARLHGAYEVTPALTISADLGYLDTMGGSSIDLWALGAEYRFGNGGFVEAGATSAGDEETWDVGLGFRF